MMATDKGPTGPRPQGARQLVVLEGFSPPARVARTRLLILRYLLFSGALMAFGVMPTWSKEKLDLQLLEIELPGPPVEVFASDLDGDAISDLLILVAYTTWDQITISEEVESDEVEGLIEMMTIVPALADRRELFFLRGARDGGFELVGGGLPVPRDVSTFIAGPSSAPVLAIDDAGLLAVRLDTVTVTEGIAIQFERLLELPTILTGGGSLLPGLGLTGDIDQDGEVDLIYPLAREFAVFLGSSPGFAAANQPEGEASEEAAPATRLERHQTIYLPGREELQLGSRRLHYPLPHLDDLNGDGFPELILLHPNRRFNDPWIATNSGGQFGPLERPLEVKGERGEAGSMVYLGDVDGDGRAEFVREKHQAKTDTGFRSEMKQAKVPPYRYHIYNTSSSFDLDGTPQVFDSTGYAFGDDSDAEFPLPGGFQDLDGDGRLDLVTITLDFTMMQLVRVMVTQSISIGLDFHIRCQQSDGSFKQVRGLDLSGKFKVRLNDLRIGQLSQFAGDFDGDGRADFVQMGRGKRVSIHRGASGCRYPAQPDLEIQLEQEPKNLSLVRVNDYDGDGFADLLVVHPRKGRGRAAATAADASTLPVTLEMHLSRSRSGQARSASGGSR